MANKKRTSPITPEQVIATRGDMSQVAAAELAGYSRRQWQNFESGAVAMPSSAYNEFVRLKNNQTAQ